MFCADVKFYAPFACCLRLKLYHSSVPRNLTFYTWCGTKVAYCIHTHLKHLKIYLVYKVSVYTSNHWSSDFNLGRERWSLQVILFMVIFRKLKAFTNADKLQELRILHAKLCI